MGLKFNIDNIRPLKKKTPKKFVNCANNRLSRICFPHVTATIDQKVFGFILNLVLRNIQWHDINQKSAGFSTKSGFVKRLSIIVCPTSPKYAYALSFTRKKVYSNSESHLKILSIWGNIHPPLPPFLTFRKQDFFTSHPQRSLLKLGIARENVLPYEHRLRSLKFLVRVDMWDAYWVSSIHSV